jgi:hypothetical protein
MTPYGAAVKMLRMHRAREVAARSSAFDEHGQGVGCLATLDDRGLAVQLWNLDPNGRPPARVEVAVGNLPASFSAGDLAVRRYLIDSTHSNCFTASASSGGLELVEERTVAAGSGLQLSARLEPMALCLLQIEPAGEGTAETPRRP